MKIKIDIDTSGIESWFQTKVKPFIDQVVLELSQIEDLKYKMIILLLLIIIFLLLRKNRYKNKSKRDVEAFDAYKGRKWYATGWTWNDKTKLWEPPDYLKDSDRQNKE